jgi:putative ABC transport system substrate-binding protein
MAMLGAAAAWPFNVRAQQGAMPTIGILGAASPIARYVDAFVATLRRDGFTVGQNVTIDDRWARGQYDKLPLFAAQLVDRPVSVILAAGGNVAARVAKTATTNIPIVFITGGDDPVKAGLVASFNRPGGNVTGVNVIASTLGPKRMEFLHQLAPKASVIGVLVNPNYSDAEFQIQEATQAAAAFNLSVVVARVAGEQEFDAAFSTFIERRVEAMFLGNDPFFNVHLARIVAFAAQNGLPSMYIAREYPANGGLISYGADFADGYRQAGTYVARILKGERPADLPVVQSSKFELVINLKTAKALGIAVPPNLLALADEVIE